MHEPMLTLSRSHCKWRTRLQDSSAGPIRIAHLLCHDMCRWLAPPAAEASLQQLPASRLQNSYFLVRAGESEAESAGVILTNPVAKTSMTSGLSSTGKRQVKSIAN